MCMFWSRWLEREVISSLCAVLGNVVSDADGMKKLYGEAPKC